MHEWREGTKEATSICTCARQRGWIWQEASTSMARVLWHFSEIGCTLSCQRMSYGAENTCMMLSHASMGIQRCQNMSEHGHYKELLSIWVGPTKRWNSELLCVCCRREHDWGSVVFTNALCYEACEHIGWVRTSGTWAAWSQKRKKVS